MSKVEENKLLKQSRLMETAFSLFTTKGFAHTTISDIVREADMAKGTFYLYFHDKYELQERLIVWKAEDLFQHVVAQSGYEKLEDPADKVIAIINDILDQLQKKPHLLKFINKNLSWGVFRRAIGRAENNYITFFQNILGIQDAQKLEIMVYTIIEFVSSTCHSVILEQNPVDLETYRPFMTRIVRKILETEL